MKKLVVAISGEPNAGSTSAAKLLAEEVNLDYFSPGRLFKDISKGTWKEQYYAPHFEKICSDLSLKVPEFTSNNDTSAVVSLWSTEFGKSPELHKAIDQLQRDLSKKGNLVLDGKLSLRMIENASLKIWLYANLQTKCARAMQRDRITLEEAKSLLPLRELKERQEWKRIYGIDYFDQREDADIVIDTSYLSTEEITSRIIKELNKNL